MSAVPERWSYSSINELLSICSLRWFFRRVERLEPDTTPAALSLGSAVHHAAAYARALQKQGREVNVDDVREVFCESWGLLTDDERMDYGRSDAASMREQGLALVEVLHASLDDDEVIAVEEEFEVSIPVSDGSERVLSGVLDLVVRDASGRITVVDLKTAAKAYGPDRIANDLQPTVYAYAARALYGACDFRYDVLLKYKRPRLDQVYVERGEPDFQRLAALIEVAERLTSAAAFFPNPSWACNGCGYSRQCAAWGLKRARRLPSAVAAREAA